MNNNVWMNYLTPTYSPKTFILSVLYLRVENF